MGKRRVAITTVASTSNFKLKQKDMSAQATQLPELQRKVKHVLSTPARRARTYLSITTTTKQRLRNLDSGRCLITFEKTPTASQQAAHIVTRKTSMKDVCSCVICFLTYG